jgi:hypothetical protein
MWISTIEMPTKLFELVQDIETYPFSKQSRAVE